MFGEGLEAISISHKFLAPDDFFELIEQAMVFQTALWDSMTLCEVDVQGNNFRISRDDEGRLRYTKVDWNAFRYFSPEVDGEFITRNRWAILMKTVGVLLSSVRADASLDGFRAQSLAEGSSRPSTEFDNDCHPVSQPMSNLMRSRAFAHLPDSFKILISRVYSFDEEIVCKTPKQFLNEIRFLKQNVEALKEDPQAYFNKVQSTCDELAGCLFASPSSVTANRFENCRMKVALILDFALNPKNEALSILSNDVDQLRESYALLFEGKDVDFWRSKEDSGQDSIEQSIQNTGSLHPWRAKLLVENQVPLTSANLLALASIPDTREQAGRQYLSRMLSSSLRGLQQYLQVESKIYEWYDRLPRLTVSTYEQWTKFVDEVRNMSDIDSLGINLILNHLKVEYDLTKFREEHQKSFDELVSDKSEAYAARARRVDSMWEAWRAALEDENQRVVFDNYKREAGIILQEKERYDRDDLNRPRSFFWKDTDFCLPLNALPPYLKSQRYQPKLQAQFSLDTGETLWRPPGLINDLFFDNLSSLNRRTREQYFEYEKRYFKLIFGVSIDSIDFVKKELSKSLERKKAAIEAEKIRIYEELDSHFGNRAMRLTNLVDSLLKMQVSDSADEEYIERAFPIYGFLQGLLQYVTDKLSTGENCLSLRLILGKMFSKGDFTAYAVVMNLLPEQKQLLRSIDGFQKYEEYLQEIAEIYQFKAMSE